MKKILLLTDFSEASHHALAVARHFFKGFVADFHLLCAFPTETDGFYTPSYVTQTANTTFTDQLHTLITDLRREATNDWHTFRYSAKPGKLLDVVQQYLDQEAYDLVIIGAKKDGTNEVFGNSATTLIRQLKVNVLVIPVDAPIRTLHQVVLATDLVHVKNCKLLAPVKELVALSDVNLTLLTIDTPGRDDASAAKNEVRIRQFFSPLKVNTAHLQASNARQGMDTYIAGHPIDLLVMIPNHKGWMDVLTGNSVTRSMAYLPPVPLLTLYDDGHSDLPRLIEDLSNLDYAL